MCQVCAVAFSADGKELAAGLVNGTARIWDVASGKERAVFQGHGGAVRGVAFGREGQTLLTAAGPQVRIWDRCTGQLRATLPGREVVFALCLSANGKTLVTAAARTIKVWRVASAETLARGEARLLVDALFDRPLCREEVLEALGKDPALAGPARKMALDYARVHEEDLVRLNNACWEVVRLAGQSRQAYRRALRQVEAIAQDETDPHHLDYLETLGVAQYRCGNDRQALTTLERCEKVRADRSAGANPVSIAVIALAHCRLGEAAKARKALRRLRDLSKQPSWINDDDTRAFVAEAEEACAMLPSPR
jgi:hypothetical protein